MDSISVGAKLMSILLKGAYSKHMEWKFERLEERARQGGMSIEDLIASDDRFAVFMRVARAFEHCSNTEVVDYLADAMIGSIKSGDVEDKPDFVQMAVGALSGVTKTELDILVTMHRHQIYVDGDFRRDHESNREAFIKECEDTLGIESTMLSAITNGLMRTSLVTSDSPGLSGAVQNPNSLSPLARELFSYINLARRLTE
ncbi:hypothetical protein [Vreelandella arctica]|uniref:hypothetical protein n=1 Tax=Vreelandella arctica TaxID=3126499 RepID=UPI00300DCEC6|tara:strand:- start:886 stop:1488 length:603 start_codon:yes stop_codon:yes gene_type:complete